jgi:hypothetical protein
MSANTQSAFLAPRWRHCAAILFSDVRIRTGIKLGLGGLLALFLTQILRLPHDSWAILTVITTTFARHVGSTAVNAITRILGTISGAIVGVWLVGNYTSTPAIFLPVFFVVMSFATYKFGQFGRRQTPYSYFIFGMTVLVIAANGIEAPDQVWQLGLYRAEEIFVGAVSALIASSIIWPRYAQKEFVMAAQNALQSVEPLLSAQTGSRLRSTHSNAALDQFRQNFANRLSALNYLRLAGARESSFFSARLASYDAYLVSLARVFDEALYVAEGPPSAVSIEDWPRKEMDQVHRGLVEEIRILSAPRSTGEPLPAGSLDAAIADLEQKIEERPKQGFSTVQQIEADVAIVSHLAALRSLRDKLNALRNISETLLEDRHRVSETHRRRDAQTKIDWTWVKIGLKGGLAATIALTLLMWLHPPGAAYVPLTAWLRITISRSSFRLGGAGDLRALQTAFLGCLALALCAAATLATTPLFAGYLAMNLALFFMLFGFGFATATTPGITFSAQLGFLIISAFVGLNSQQPVLSQSIVDTFSGIGIGLFIGAAVRRFAWPTLPQTVLRENLLGILADLKRLLSGDPHREASLVRLLLLSVEAYQVVLKIPLRSRFHAKGNNEGLTALTLSLLALIPRVIYLTTLRVDLPQPANPLLRLPLERLKGQFERHLNIFAEYIKSGPSQRALPTLDRAMGETEVALRRMHDWKLLTNHPVTVPLLTLAIVARYRAVADDLNKLCSLIVDPQINSYWDDYAL